jgi:hypothetical protein
MHHIPDYIAWTLSLNGVDPGDADSATVHQRARELVAAWHPVLCRLVEEADTSLETKNAKRSLGRSYDYRFPNRYEALWKRRRCISGGLQNRSKRIVEEALNDAI